MGNPYFTYFNVRPKANERFTMVQDGELVVEIATNDEFIKEMKQTKFGVLFKNTHHTIFRLKEKMHTVTENLWDTLLLWLLL